MVNLPGVAYAREMGELNVRSKGEEEAYAKLVAAEGADRAKSIKALAIFLYWGGMTGNTVNCTKKRLIGVAPLKGLTLFAVLFFLWYGPLFFVVFFYNSCVIPAFVSPLPTIAAHTCPRFASRTCTSLRLAVGAGLIHLISWPRSIHLLPVLCPTPCLAVHCTQRAVFGDASKRQVWFFKITGFVLWLLALLWILPLGLLALILSICVPSLRDMVEGQLEKELEMV